MSKHNSPPNMGELRRPNTLSRRRSNAWKICASWVDAVAISTIIHIQPPRYVGTVQGGEGEEVSPAFRFNCVRRPEVLTSGSTPAVRFPRQAEANRSMPRRGANTLLSKGCAAPRTLMSVLWPRRFSLFCSLSNRDRMNEFAVGTEPEDLATHAS